MLCVVVYDLIPFRLLLLCLKLLVRYFLGILRVFFPPGFSLNLSTPGSSWAGSIGQMIPQPQLSSLTLSSLSQLLYITRILF